MRFTDNIALLLNGNEGESRLEILNRNFYVDFNIFVAGFCSSYFYSRFVIRKQILPSDFNVENFDQIFFFIPNKIYTRGVVLSLLYPIEYARQNM